MKKIKLLAVTGIRSEYDLLFPIISHLRSSSDFDVQLVVSGAHLSNKHGLTIDLIKKDGFSVLEEIYSLYDTDNLIQRPLAVAALINGLASIVNKAKPDVLFVVGDREESIATAIVGNYMNVLTAHLGGGDPVYGNADDPIRCAVSKIAHVHFTTNKQYSDNLIKMGEDPNRVVFSGTPGLDNIIAEPLISIDAINSFFGITLNDFVVFIKHPLSSEVENCEHQIKTSIAALKKFQSESEVNVVAIYPNSDPGSQIIINFLDQEESDNFVVSKTLPRNIFVNLLRNAKALVGNSSMGILEAPMYGLPVVNIGNRQKGRINAGNVDFVPYDTDLIVQALNKACFDEDYRNKIRKLENPYGSGNSAEIIRNKLFDFVGDKKLLTKTRLIP